VCDWLFCVCMTLLLKAGIAYVPALHSNTSLLKAWFSQVRSMNKDFPCNYCTAHATTHASSAVAALWYNWNKSYIVKMLQPKIKIACHRSISRTEGQWMGVILCKITSGKTSTKHANFTGTVIPAWQPSSGLILQLNSISKKKQAWKNALWIDASFQIIVFMGFAQSL